MSGKGDKRNDPKKPSAIIDLKATEVADGSKKGGAGAAKRDAKSAAAASSSGAQAGAGPKPGAPTGTASALKAGAGSRTAPAAAGDTKSGSASAAAGGAASAAGSAGAARAGAKTPTGGASGGSGGSGDDGNAKGRSAAPPPRPRRSWGILSTLTHAIAAIIGGAVVLFGGEQLAERISKETGYELPIPARTAEIPDEYRQRLAAIEQSQRAASEAQATLPDDVAAKLARVDEQDAMIQRLTETIDELRATQQAAAEGGGNGSGGAVPAEVTERITALERTIETLSQATGGDGQPSNVAQIAALSGKLADLEGTIDTQLNALRSRVMSDIDERLAPAAQASEAARSGTQRMDRELAETKAEVSRIGQRVETLSATTDRLEENVRTVREETGKLASDLKAMRGDLSSDIAQTAKPDDIQQAVGPISEKLASLSSKLDDVVANEGTRQANAERVVLALQLNNLRRALDRGGPFAKELDAVQSVAGDKVDLSALEPYKSEGVPNAAALLREFRNLSFDVISATERDPNASWMESMLAGAKSIVRVRRTGDAAAQAEGAEGVVARIEQLLLNGELAAAADAAKQLPPQAKDTAAPWLKRLNARAAVDQAIAEIEGNLKDTLTGGGASKS